MRPRHYGWRRSQKRCLFSEVSVGCDPQGGSLSHRAVGLTPQTTLNDRITDIMKTYLLRAPHPVEPKPKLPSQSQPPPSGPPNGPTIAAAPPLLAPPPAASTPSSLAHVSSRGSPGAAPAQGERRRGAGAGTGRFRVGPRAASETAPAAAAARESLR